jgi:hypothetical protein
MAKHTFGLVNVEIGAIAGDGGMGTVLTPVGETVLGTMQMGQEDPTTTDFSIEESDSPVESVVTTPGVLTVAWSCYNLDADTMVKFFGGTKVTGPPVTWSAPDTFADVEVSLKITDKKGNVFAMPRVKIRAKLSASFRKDALGQIDLIATILQPTKVAEPRIKVTYA